MNRIGERLYKFDKRDGLTKAREIYATFTGNQDAFEFKLKAAGIEFTMFYW